MSPGCHGGAGGGGGIHAGANGGAYAGRGMYHSGTGGGGLHSLVHTLRDQFGSHCAELIPGAAIVTAAIRINTTAGTEAARRQRNLVIVGLQKDPSLTLACVELMPGSVTSHPVAGERER